MTNLRRRTFLGSALGLAASAALPRGAFAQGRPPFPLYDTHAHFYSNDTARYPFNPGAPEAVRQRIIDLRPDVKEDGIACCGIVLDPVLVATRPHPRRAFQGWRYLEAADAPPDVKGFADAPDDIPRGMREELRELRLIDW